MSDKVKAAVMVKPGEIRIREFPYPEIHDNDALIRMEMSGICGTDKHNYKGETSLGMGPSGGYRTPFPIIPGHENVGVIEEIGEKAAKKLEVDGKILRKGDRVFPVNDVLCGECYWCRTTFGYQYCPNWYCYGLISCEKPPHLFGGWSEFMYLVPEVSLFKVPDGVPPEVAVLTEPVMVAYGSFNKAMAPFPMAREGFGQGDTVVVQGAGPLGMSHVIVARLFGAGEIIAVEPKTPQSEHRLKIAKELGATRTVNIPEAEERVEEIMRLTDGLGADLIIEATGAPRAIPEGLDMLRRGGTYLVAGTFVDVGDVEINPWKHILTKQARILGVSGWPIPRSSRVLKLFEQYSNVIPFEKMVTHKFKVEQAKEAIETSIVGNAVKVVITP